VPVKLHRQSLEGRIVAGRMEWEQFEELGFGMSDMENEPEPIVSVKFLDRLPNEMIERHIWPRLLVLPPFDSAGKLLRTLTQEEQKEYIRQMCLLRRVCHGWKD
jgi:hypothetical protein